MKKVFLSLVFVFILACCHAQQKYWIYLKDKTDNLIETLSYSDLPLSHVYLDSLGLFSVNPIVKSRWLNAISAVLDQNQINTLDQLEFVSSIERINAQIHVNKLNGSHPFKLSKVLDQIDADTIINMGLTGKGVKIGIIDAGFLGADQDNYLINLMDSCSVIGFKNYIETNDFGPFEGTLQNNDRHGTDVLRAIAGQFGDSYAGLAIQSKFLLARTDQSDKEYHDEEDFWIAALEWMNDEGVKVINSSLGYSNGYDNPEENYKPENVDGGFSAITRAATIAVKEKGMTIVLSAGNDGNNNFKVISIPADADGIISVGATGYRYWNKLNYSSIGSELLEMVKPEIACHAADGTSFSAPAIAGLIACMFEYKPQLKNYEIAEIIKKSAHLYPYPNNYLGYGVPNARKIITLLNNPDTLVSQSLAVRARSDDGFSIKLAKNYNVMAFHKKNETIVLEQEKLKWVDGSVFVKPLLGATYTTVATADKVWEITWIY